VCSPDSSATTQSASWKLPEFENSGSFWLAVSGMTANWDVNPQRATDRAEHRQDEHDLNGSLSYFALHVIDIVVNQHH